MLQALHRFQDIYYSDVKRERIDLNLPSLNYMLDRMSFLDLQCFMAKKKSIPILRMQINHHCTTNSIINVMINVKTSSLIRKRPGFTDFTITDDDHILENYFMVNFR